MTDERKELVAAKSAASREYGRVSAECDPGDDLLDRAYNAWARAEIAIRAYDRIHASR